jgi:hypothetical protein
VGWGGEGVGGWCGGPGHYLVTPTRVEVELDCDNTGIFNQNTGISS